MHKDPPGSVLVCKRGDFGQMPVLCKPVECDQLAPYPYTYEGPKMFVK